MFSLDLTLRSYAQFGRSKLPHENLYTKLDCNSLGITYLKRKRKERRFADLRTILILHCGN